MSRKVLVIAAHPDDEILGCGGTIARHTGQGDEVRVLIMAEGITSRDPELDRDARKEELSALGKTAQEANRALGVERLTLDAFPDNRMDTVSRLDVTKRIEQAISEFQPGVVYTHHCGDVNIDHRRIHDAVVTSCRPMPGAADVHELLFFEVASSTEWQPPGSAEPFTPNWFVEISDYLETKLDALRIYESEMRPWPHARSIEAVTHQARWRGATIGVEAAEAFVLGRRLRLQGDKPL
jgi:LmbE family N-acetylglucosaminyl deacetylase